ncbi:hypothetical protein Syun_008995 [Stephania yunnanensis]|uniref:Uncharacterized protein n=1 Tax=Stephania yunnanensis TaxID=152371 RepID=A0AAP0PRW1_9MAGN
MEVIGEGPAATNDGGRESGGRDKGEDGGWEAAREVGTVEAGGRDGGEETKAAGRRSETRRREAGTTAREARTTRGTPAGTVEARQTDGQRINDTARGGRWRPHLGEDGAAGRQARDGAREARTPQGRSDRRCR